MVITLIAGALLLISIVATVAISLNNTRASAAGLNRRMTIKPLVLSTAVLVVAFIASLGLRIIPAGYVGVVTFFGEVEDRVLPPGMAFVLPIAEGVTEVETRVRGISFENLGAASKEYQDVFITGTLNIHVNNEGANDLYQQVGLDYSDKIVMPFFATIIKEIVPTYSIDQVLGARAEIRQRTVDALNAKLAPYHITVDDVALSQLSFSPAYTQAIENKQVQEQKVLEEQQILEQKQIQADQAEAVAAGEARANIERATGEAEANRLLTESITPELIQYLAIDKLSDDIKIALVPSDNGFILDVGDLGLTPGAAAGE